MFKSVIVIFALIACVAAKPGLIGAPLAYHHAPAALIAAAPAPIVTATSNQVIARNFNGIAHAPIVAPVAAPVGAPLAAAHIAAPLTAYSSPLVHRYAAAAPLAYTSPLAYSSPLAARYVASPYAAAYASPYAATAYAPSFAAPLHYAANRLVL